MMPPHAGSRSSCRTDHVEHAEWSEAAGASQEPSLKFHTICVIGLGYIGLPTASTLAGKGFRPWC